jgi:hypothetical protein
MIATDTTAPAGATDLRSEAALGARSRASAPPASAPPASAPPASARGDGALVRPRAAEQITRATVLRRRLVALAGLVLLLTLVTVAVGRVGAEAELADRVAGHAVLGPGDTLWDVAVSSAPDGVDPREQLAAIRVLNGFEDASVDAWTVVLLPAR